MLSQVSLTESVAGSIQDPLQYLSGSSSFNCSPDISTVLDYVDGDFKPFWFNWQMHAAHRADCRKIHQAITLSYNIAENLENYVIGQGFTYTAKSRLDRSTDRLLVSAVQSDIKRILQENSFCEVDFSEAGDELGSLEAQIHNRTRRDGEDFIGIYSPNRGEIRLRLINAEHVTDHPGASLEFERNLNLKFAQNWKYGIHTAVHDAQRALGYVVQWDAAGGDIDYFPSNSWERAVQFQSGLMHHIKRNVDAKVKRGMSDFFPVAKQLTDDAKLLRNVVMGAQAQAAIAWIEQFENESRSRAQAEEITAQTAGTKVAKSQSPQVVTRQPTDFQRSLTPGSVITVGAGKKYLPGPMGAERNSGFELVSKLSVQRIGVRWVMPEYMISADPSNGNRASTEVAEGPFMKARQKDQWFYAGHFRKILWKCLLILTAQGLYRKYGVNTIKDLMMRVGIDVTCPNVVSRDQLAAAQANEILHTHGVLSTKSWQVQADLDPGQEQANQQASGEAPAGTASGDSAQDSDSPPTDAAGEPAAPVQNQLNGAQIIAANDIVGAMSRGETPLYVGKELLRQLGIPAEIAARMAKEATLQSQNKLAEEDINRIAQRVQKTFWEDLSQKAESYP